MTRSVTATLTLAAILVSGQLTPALAKQISRHHPGKYMAGHTASAARSGAGVPESKPLSPTARDAEQAITWQNALHGEID